MEFANLKCVHKKILHISHTDVRVDSRILKQMRGASANGYEVVGIGVQDVERVVDTSALDLNIITVKLRTKRLTFMPKLLRHLLVFLEFYFRIFWTCLKIRPDLVHCNDTLVLPIGLSIKLIRRCILVYDAHELESNRNGISLLLGKATLFVEKAAWRWIDGLICVSPSIQRWYFDNIGKLPSAVVLNSPEMFTYDGADRQYLRQKFSIPADALIYIYVGITAPGRGIDTYLQAFQAYAGAHIVFLGYGVMANDLKGYAAENENIHFHDPVDHQDVVSIVRSADVGLCLVENVSLSDYFCLPNKLFEYAFSEVPVIASDFPDISDFVHKYRLGLTIPPTKEGIMEALKKFSNKEFLRTPKVAELSELSWDSQVMKMLKLYRELGI